MARILYLLVVFMICSSMGFGFLLPVQSPEKNAETIQTVVLSNDVHVKPLAEGVWLHVSYREMSDYGRVPANGLIVVNNGSALLIDTPWTNEQTAVLLDWIETELKAKITAVIPTHSHIDCIGGLGEVHKRGATSYAYEQTAVFAKADKGPVPKVLFKKNHKIQCGNIEVTAAFLGGGHTKDNIVVWLPHRKILFGGCMVKSLHSQSLGFIKEADLDGWPKTLVAVKNKFNDAELVIPGHGKPGSIELLSHTIELLKDYHRKKHQKKHQKK